MNNAQAQNLNLNANGEIIKESSDKLPPYYGMLKTTYVFSIILYFVLNFLATPLLKPLFAIITFQTFLIAILIPWNLSSLYIAIFLLIESQGRIIWGYHPFFRLCFDMITGLCILRVFVSKRKMFELPHIPKVTLIFIILHFLWFFIQLFNPVGPGILATFATSKYYIFPFFLYFCSLLVPIDFKDKNVEFLIKFLTFCILLEAALAIFQLKVGQDYFFKISPNFMSLFKKMQRFQGTNYRPWGTSRDPGGYSSFIYYLIGFVFLYTPKVRVKLYQLYTTALVLICMFANFASSVRSALLKYIMVIIGVITINFFSTHKKVVFTWKVGLGLVAAFLTILITIAVFPNIEKQLNLAKAVSRITELTEKDGVSKQRASFDIIFSSIVTQTEMPFGYGPGMCTNYMPQFQQTRETLKKHGVRNYWTHDNLYLSLFLELGIGAIFYIGAILSIPLVLAAMSIDMYRRGKAEEIYPTAFGAIFTVIVVIGNWGAIAIPFNPTSYVFWFWAAHGCHNYYKYFPKTLKNKAS